MNAGKMLLFVTISQLHIDACRSAAAAAAAAGSGGSGGGAAAAG